MPTRVNHCMSWLARYEMICAPFRLPVLSKTFPGALSPSMDQ